MSSKVILKIDILPNGNYRIEKIGQLTPTYHQSLCSSHYALTNRGYCSSEEVFTGTENDCREWIKKNCTNPTMNGERFDCTLNPFQENFYITYLHDGPIVSEQ